MTLRIDFAFPGDLATPTGGYGYDRRLIAELEALGAQVRTISLPKTFPDPSPADLEETRRLLGDGARDALIVDGLAFGALPASLVATLAPKPVALVHHPLCLETGLSQERAAALAASERAAVAHAGAVVTTSRMTADIVARDFDVPRERLFSAEPGVDPASRARGSGDGPTHLLSVGSLLPRKGYGDLVRALAQVGGAWRLRIIGSLAFDPACAAAVQRLVAEYGLGDRIALDGALPAASVAAAYAEADAFVTASHFEGYGMAIAEAVARGLPIVAAHEALAAGAAPADATLGFPAGDVAALAARIDAIVGDSALRAAKSEAAWAAAGRQIRWRDAGLVLLDAMGGVKQEMCA